MDSYLLQSKGGGSGVVAPLRYVTAGNQFMQTTKTFTGVLLGNAYKDIHYVGSGDVNSLYVEFNNCALGQSSFSPFTVPELWVTLDGQGAGVQVTWSGSTSTTVAAGVARYRSDPINIAALGGAAAGGTLPRGSKLWVAGRSEALVNAIIPGIIIRNPGTNQALQYTPGSTTINNLSGSAAMTGTPGAGTQATANQAYGLPTLTGTFVAGDLPVFAFIGDSITMGYFSSAQTISYGCSYRGLFDNFATFSNPRAGIVIARVGSSATDWSSNGTVTAALAACCPGATHFLERFGINTITSDLGSAGATTLINGRQTAVWATIRANPNSVGRAPKIYALPLTPHVLGAAMTGISGDGTTVTVTGLPTSFVSSIGTVGATLAGAAIRNVTPSGYNATGVTITVASTTSITYPNATVTTATVMGNVDDGWVSTGNQFTTPGCGQGQEVDFVNSQMVTRAGLGAPTGPDFYFDDTSTIRANASSANANWFLWNPTSGPNTTEGLHPGEPNGYNLLAAAQRALEQSIT